MEPQGGIHEEARVDSALAARLRLIHLIAGIAGAAWLLSACVGGLLLSNRNITDRLDAAAKTAQADTKATATLVARTFHELTSIPQVLSGNQRVQAILRRYNARETAFGSKPEAERRQQLESDPDVVRLGDRLTALSAKLGYAAVYLLDSRGIRVISSERSGPVRPLGVDLEDREYFKDAMAGRLGHMFAVSRSSQVPVFFFSAPVEDDGVPVGVVVLQEATGDVGAVLASSRTLSLIVDKYGMVVATSHPEFFLRHVPVAERSHLGHATSVIAAPTPENLRTVYTQESLRSIAITLAVATGWINRPLHESERVINGRPYLVMSDPLNAYPAYSLFVMTPIDWVDDVRHLHQLFIALVTLLGLLIILFGDRRAVNLTRRAHDARVTAALNEKLQVLNRDKDRYLGIAAHDLRNPLSSMRGLAELMLEMPLEPQQQREFLQTIHRTSDEMLGLVNDLLDVSVIESGKLALKRTDHDLVKMVQRRVRHLEPHARTKNITVTVDAPEGQRASIDGSRFNQVVDNLVSNAIKFSPPGSTVKVSMRSSGGNLLFTVQDQGPGIPEEDRKLLFRSFQKLSARPTGGEKSTGLGLAIVKKIVDAHSGTITVENAPEGGALFSVTVPATSS